MEKWWKQRVVYQVYPRSFQDSNGDGMGDLPGITSRLDYLKALGVGILWLSPVYASPGDDNGYDISDYCAIDPRFGTMADMDALLKEAKARDIRIVMDLVVNHTSTSHEWFQKSRRRIPPYTDYYIWQPGKNGKKPNNWTGFFGEDCWVFDEVRGEYYLHLFAKSQADLNYHNANVVEEVKNVMRFWLDKGVSGFRCDVINVLYKDSLASSRKRLILTGREHYLTLPGTHAILQELRRDVLAGYDCFTVGETCFVTPKEGRDLCEPARGELDMIFNFEHMETDQYFVKWFHRKFSARRLGEALARWQTALTWSAVYFENHDQPRSVSRFGDDGRFHDESAKMLCTLLLSLRGTPYIYQGQELGMTNFDYASMAQLDDVESKNIDRLLKRLGFSQRARWRKMQRTSRDNARTPMQWTAAPNAGFTPPGVKPWLGVNANHTRINAAAQMADENSVWHYYRKMLALRAASPVLLKGDFKLLAATDALFAFTRRFEGEQMTVLCSFCKTVQSVPYRGKICLSSYGKDAFDGALKPYEAVILTEEASL